MNTLLFLLLMLTPTATPAQVPAAQPDGPPLEILDAGVKVYPPPRIVKGPPGPGALSGSMSMGDLPGQNGTSRQSSKASSPSRAAELNRAEEGWERRTMSRTRGGAMPTTSYLYEYRLKVRNVGSKKVKSLLWEYRVVDPHVTAAAASTLRLFQCVEGMKPGQSKPLRAFSVKAPGNVVSADGAGSEPKSGVVINRVEYADGSAWQREGWEPGEAKILNPEEVKRRTRKVRGQWLRGECLAL